MYKEINKVLGTDYKSDQEINWNFISIYKRLSEEFILEYSNYLNWGTVIIFQSLSENLIRIFSDRINLWVISEHQVLSESFIEDYKNSINWGNISSNQVLSWNFILKHKDLVNWTMISMYQPFIDPGYHKIDQDTIKLNHLSRVYQATKDQEWFIGYVRIWGKVYGNYNFYTIPHPTSNTLMSESLIKSKIFWKDLVMIDKIKEYEPIREVKYV